jgi:hypothetical protein
MVGSEPPVTAHDNVKETPSEMGNFIDRVLAERRTLEQALADLRAKYDREHDPDVAAMIRYGEAEILDRRRAARGQLAGQC